MLKSLSQVIFPGSKAFVYVKLYMHYLLKQAALVSAACLSILQTTYLIYLPLHSVLVQFSAKVTGSVILFVPGILRYLGYI